MVKPRLGGVFYFSTLTLQDLLLQLLYLTP